MSLLEFTAVIISALGVWISTRRNMLCWPVGLVSVLLYGWIFWHAKLYSDMLLQFIFAGLQVYGWRRWSQRKNECNEVAVTRIPPRVCAIDLLVGALGSIALGYPMSAMTDSSLPWLD